MYEVYVLVKRKKSVATILLGALFLALAVAFLIASCVSMVAFCFVIVFTFLWYLFQFQMNKEFEYSFFDGDVRFAKVMNKSRRKALKSFSMDEVIQIAPAGDRCVYRYENDQSVKVIDYTSGYKDVPYYDMIVKNQDQISLIKFEPDEKYLDAVCVKYAQKVVRRPQ